MRLHTGSGRVFGDDTIKGYTRFTLSSTGDEVTAALESRNASSYFLRFDNTNGVTTGIGVANSQNQTANIPFVVRDDSGMGSQVLPFLFPQEDIFRFFWLTGLPKQSTNEERSSSVPLQRDASA